jgi:phosphate starvation-inducible PhoH-like protein
MKKKNKTQPELVQPLNNNPDHSPVIPQRSKLKFDLHIIERPDLTPRQKEFISLALDKKAKLIFLSGPAGTTKSFLSIYCALKLLNEKRVSDLIYVRSIVESSDCKLGYLPGEIASKIHPYMEVLHDKLAELLPKTEINLLEKDQRLNPIPINFLRGAHWNAKFIFCDEAQNLTSRELITLMTRVGEYSKIILAGDPDQSDVKGNSGFINMLNLFDDELSKQNGIYTFKFEEEDVLRSKLVKFIVGKLRKQN